MALPLGAPTCLSRPGRESCQDRQGILQAGASHGPSMVIAHIHPNSGYVKHTVLSGASGN